jgi:hypothetical protein
MTLLDTFLHPDDLDERTRTHAFELADIPGYKDLIEHSNSIDDRKLLASLLWTWCTRILTCAAFSLSTW